MSVVRSQIFYINSENRTSGSSSNFTINLDLPDGSNFDSVVVLSMSLPLSYYLIRSPYNTLTLKEAGVSVLITVVPGNYDARTFATALSSLLNQNSPNGWFYSILLDTTLAKYTYSVIGNLGSQPSLIFSSHLADQTGFSLHSTNPFVGGSLVSTAVLNFVSTNCLFLHSDIVEDQTSVLQEIYSNNTIPYSFIVFNCPNTDLYTKRLKTNTAGSFNFSLTDEHNIEVNLNGHEIAITLMLYKKLSMGEMLKKYLEFSFSKK